MYILLAGINHKTAPIELRERIALSGKELEMASRELYSQPFLEGVVILSTCNRTEVYATVRDVEEGARVLREYVAQKLQLSEMELERVVYQPGCYEAIAHLFRVAAGLDSMIVGESQILGQVKDAYLAAQEYGTSNGVLNNLFQKAIYVGKRVRTETGLDRHAVSISYAAVEKAKKIFGNLKGRTVLVVGAGEMSELVLKYLLENGVSTVVVSNRSYDRATCLAERFGGMAVRFEEFARHINQADIVISCTAAHHYVLHRGNLIPYLEGRDRPLLLIDIAVPRDIDPALGKIEGVHLYDIDDLNNVVNINIGVRRKAAHQAKQIIEEELDEFNNWLATLYVIPVIRALKGKGEEIKEAEIKRALNRLGEVSVREEKIIRSLASSIVNQLLHFPVINLKEMALTNQGHLYAEVLKKLFDLVLENEENQVYVENNGRLQRQQAGPVAD